MIHYNQPRFGTGPWCRQDQYGQWWPSGRLAGELGHGSVGGCGGWKRGWKPEARDGSLRVGG